MDPGRGQWCMQANTGLIWLWEVIPWTLMQCLLNEFLLVGCHTLAEGQVE